MRIGGESVVVTGSTLGPDGSVAFYCTTLGTVAVGATIEEATYRYFLEVLPPHYQADGVFAFAEGREPLRVFIYSYGCYYARQLTWQETEEFCAAAHIPLPS